MIKVSKPSTANHPQPKGFALSSHVSHTSALAIARCQMLRVSLSTVLVVWICSCSSPASACYSCSSNHISSNGCSQGYRALREIQVQAIVGSTWLLKGVQPYMRTHHKPLSPGNGDSTPDAFALRLLRSFALPCSLPRTKGISEQLICPSN